MSFGSYSGAAGQARSCTPQGSRKGLEIVGIVFGFFYFWPLAAAYLAWKFMGYPIPAELRATVQQGISNLFGGLKPFSNARWNSASFSATGNRAFDDYRRGEIERLEQERRRLDDEARDFRSFVDDLKRAKDREEFDSYMAKRRAG